MNITQDECQDLSVVSYGDFENWRAGQLRMKNSKDHLHKDDRGNVWNHLKKTVDGWNPGRSKILKSCGSSKGLLILQLQPINRPKEFPATRMIVYVTSEMYGLNADGTYPKLQSLNLHGQDFEMLLPAVFLKKKLFSLWDTWKFSTWLPLPSRSLTVRPWKVTETQ